MSRNTLALSDLTNCTVKELREQCKHHSVSATGNKPDLLKRLQKCLSVDEDDNSGTVVSKGDVKSSSSTSLEELSKCKLPELKEQCKTNGLAISGKKSELVERLANHFATKKEFVEESEEEDDETEESDDEEDNEADDEDTGVEDDEVKEMTFEVAQKLMFVGNGADQRVVEGLSTEAVMEWSHVRKIPPALKLREKVIIKGLEVEDHRFEVIATVCGMSKVNTVHLWMMLDRDQWLSTQRKKSPSCTCCVNKRKENKLVVHWDENLCKHMVATLLKLCEKDCRIADSDTDIDDVSDEMSVSC